MTGTERLLRRHSMLVPWASIRNAHLRPVGFSCCIYTPSKKLPTLKHVRPTCPVDLRKPKTSPVESPTARPLRQYVVGRYPESYATITASKGGRMSADDLIHRSARYRQITVFRDHPCGHAQSSFLRCLVPHLCSTAVRNAADATLVAVE